MLNATFTLPDLDQFCRLDRLGLSVIGQLIEPDHSVLECVPTTVAKGCPGCGGAGARHDTVVRRLAHVPYGWKPTILHIQVPRYRCVACRRIWRHDITPAAPARGKLSRDAVMQAVKSVVIDRLSIARIAAEPRGSLEHLPQRDPQRREGVVVQRPRPVDGGDDGRGR